MLFDNSQVRRQDRLLDEARAKELLSCAEYGVLSLVDEDGSPYGVPVNFVWVEERCCIYVHCAPEGRKLRAIDACSEVSFAVVGETEVLSGKFTANYESVIIRATARRNLPEEERLEGLVLFLEKYSPNDVGAGYKYALRSFCRTEVLRLDLVSMSAKSKRIKP